MAQESLDVDVNYTSDGNGDHYDSFDIYRLPENCIANALSRTSPRDTCRLSVVARDFRSAAQSDAVWERFFPNDYKEIISRSVNSSVLLLSFERTKDLYLHLSDHPIIIDSGTKSFSLEKSTGKKCFMLAARDLTIIWGDTPTYWQWISDPQSRFPEVAELLDVCWLEIRGRIDTSMLSPDTTFAAYLVFSMTHQSYGFNREPAKGWVSTSSFVTEKRTIFVDPEGAAKYRHQSVPRRNRRLANLIRQQNASSMDCNAEYPNKRGDGWNEVLLGEFDVKAGQDGEVQMNFVELKGGNWKSGLIIEGIEIRPKVK